MQNSLVYITEENLHTNAFTEPVPRVEQAIRELADEFTSNLVNQKILQEARLRLDARVAERSKQYDAAVCINLFGSFVDFVRAHSSVQIAGILEIAYRTTTHVRDRLIT